MCRYVGDYYKSCRHDAHVDNYDIYPCIMVNMKTSVSDLAQQICNPMRIEQNPRGREFCCSADHCEQSADRRAQKLSDINKLSAEHLSRINNGEKANSDEMRALSDAIEKAQKRMHDLTDKHPYSRAECSSRRNAARQEIGATRVKAVEMFRLRPPLNPR